MSKRKRGGAWAPPDDSDSLVFGDVGRFSDSSSASSASSDDDVRPAPRRPPKRSRRARVPSSPSSGSRSSSPVPNRLRAYVLEDEIQRLSGTPFSAAARAMPGWHRSGALATIYYYIENSSPFKDVRAPAASGVYGYARLIRQAVEQVADQDMETLVARDGPADAAWFGPPNTIDGGDRNREEFILLLTAHFLAASIGRFNVWDRVLSNAQQADVAGGRGGHYYRSFLHRHLPYFELATTPGELEMRDSRAIERYLDKVSKLEREAASAEPEGSAGSAGSPAFYRGTRTC